VAAGKRGGRFQPRQLPQDARRHVHTPLLLCPRKEQPLILKEGPTAYTVHPGAPTTVGSAAGRNDQQPTRQAATATHNRNTHPSRLHHLSPPAPLTPRPTPQPQPQPGHDNGVSGAAARLRTLSMQLSPAPCAAPAPNTSFFEGVQQVGSWLVSCTILTPPPPSRPSLSRFLAWLPHLLSNPHLHHDLSLHSNPHLNSPNPNPNPTQTQTQPKPKPNPNLPPGPPRPHPGHHGGLP